MLAGLLVLATPAVAQPTASQATVAPSAPSESPALDLRSSVEAALAWHPGIRGALSAFEQSNDYVDVARAGYYPQVSAGLGSEFGRRDIAGYDSRRLHRFTVTVSQMLYDFGKVSSAVESAQAQRLAEQGRILLAIDDVARDTALAWIEVGRAQALLTIAHEQAAGVQSIAGRVRERHRLGASPLSDEAQARAREEAAQAFELDTDAQLQRWRNQLQLLTGLSPLSGSNDTAVAALDQACRAPGPAQRPPVVLVAQAEQRAAEADARHARAQALPTLSIDGSASRGLDSPSREYGPYDATVMFNVSAPLYQGGGLQARRRAALHASDAAVAAVEQARLTTAQSWQDARQRADGQVARTRLLDARVQSIEQTRDLYRQQYFDLGTRSLLDLLNAEQEFHLARQDQTNNHYELERAQVECLHANGRLHEVFAADAALAAAPGVAP
ncbi:MAG TPA: TolC family outer membrane protein [Stenotrophomonas sp.]